MMPRRACQRKIGHTLGFSANSSQTGISVERLLSQPLPIRRSLLGTYLKATANRNDSLLA